MFWLFILAITMPNLSNCEKAVNLTEITWDHAVNSWAQLNLALESPTQMIEADVIIGFHTKNNTKIGNDAPTTAMPDTVAANKTMPVMGHPPNDKSDLSLEQFLKAIIDHNKKDAFQSKGVKLDFKSIEAVTESIPHLKKHWANLTTVPVWINADILEGPVNSTVKPVDANKFLTIAKELSNATLSIGWTTKWGAEYKTGMYSEAHVDAMIKVIGENKINATSHPITFPVRAGIAAHSKVTLRRLFDSVNKTNHVTFTIWSSQGDNVDIKHLQEFILSFGVDRVYVDVPKEVQEKLNLGEKSKNSATSIVQFGLLNVITFMVVVFLRNGLN